MIDETRDTMSEAVPPRYTSALLLAVGGVAAGFGAASCCALPLLLSSLGLGSAWLLAVAWIAAPHRLTLLGVAVVCLATGGGVLLWHRWRLATCTAGACESPAKTSIVTGLLFVGAVLVVLGWMYA
jgi:mercuric ion transport protein